MAKQCAKMSLYSQKSSASATMWLNGENLTRQVEMAVHYSTRGSVAAQEEHAGGIQDIRQLQYSPGSEEPFHAHEQGQFIYALRGVAKIRTGQQIWVLSAGKALWLPSHMPHGLEALDNVITQNIYFYPGASQRYHPHCRGLAVTPLLHTLIDAGMDKTADTRRHHLVNALLNDEFLRLPTSVLCHITLPLDRRLRQVCDILYRQPDHNATLAWWGKQVGASERTLARLFREETQLSFSEWRQQIRLLEAVCNLARGVAKATWPRTSVMPAPVRLSLCFGKKWAYRPSVISSRA